RGRARRATPGRGRPAGRGGGRRAGERAGEGEQARQLLEPVARVGGRLDPDAVGRQVVAVELLAVDVAEAGRIEHRHVGAGGDRGEPAQPLRGGGLLVELHREQGYVGVRSVVDVRAAQDGRRRRRGAEARELLD